MSTVSSLSSSAVNTEIQTVETRLEAPIKNLGTQVSADKALISAWGSISGAVSTLSDNLGSIKNLSTITNLGVTSSNNGVVTATAGANAKAGVYNLTNVTLAKAQEIYSSLLGSADSTLTGGAGTLAITLADGQSETISLGSGSLTPAKIAEAINAQHGGVQASIVGTKAGSRLVLTSSGTGSSTAFSVSGTGALAQFSYSSGSAGSEILAQKATDAALTLNGIPLTSTSNVLGSAVAGVTISLTGSGNAGFSVTSSPVGLSSNLSAVISSLNGAISSISTETKYVAASSASSSSAQAGPLLGNFSATNLKNELMGAVSSLQASGVSANNIGLSINNSGSISFNNASFATAYAANPAGVEKLISKLYTSLTSVADGAIGTPSSAAFTGTSITGFISAQTSSLNQSINAIEQQITLLTKQSSATLKALASEYTVAESKASTASITRAYLSIFLGSSSSSSS